MEKARTQRREHNPTGGGKPKSESKPKQKNLDAHPKGAEFETERTEKDESNKGNSEL